MKTNNNKLANYIDNVRRLQKENAKMIRQIEVIESSQAKEIQDLRGIYDREIGDLKAAIKTMQVSSLPRSEAYSFILNTGFEGVIHHQNNRNNGIPTVNLKLHKMKKKP